MGWHRITLNRSRHQMKLVRTDQCDPLGGRFYNHVSMEIALLLSLEVACYPVIKNIIET